jgi:hypothetical protein
MPNSQPSNSSSNSALTQLLEVDAQLAAQEAQLSTQLQSVQEKRKSLKTVIDLFAPAKTTLAAVAPTPTPAVAPNGKPELSVQDSATPALDGSESTSTPRVDINGKHDLAVGDQTAPELDSAQATLADSATPAADKQNQKAQKAPATVKRRQSAKPAREATKTARRTEGWQDYLREEFSDVPLPNAVFAVLRQHEKQALDIAAVVDAIFDEQMSQQVRVKARDRVSNILSEGARKNKWYRADAGSYSVSKATT